MRAAGGEVRVADEPALREFPPLRAGWSLRGHPALVTITGRNAQRTLFGALNVSTGELVCLPLVRCRTDDIVDAVTALGQVHPGIPKLLIWDNAPPHHPHRVRDAGDAVGITLAFLPFRAPELMPLEELWRGLTQTVEANRCYASLNELVTRALTWLTTLARVLRRWYLRGLHWLSEEGI
jgi:transposase